MISRRAMMVRAAASAAVAGCLGRSAALAASDYELLNGLDRDRDDTVDLEEARLAAGRLFDIIDRDHEGTLSRHELSGRLSVHELAAADPDHDRTLSRDEYLALVEQRFKLADADHDGTLTAAELRTRAGLVLLRLLK